MFFVVAAFGMKIKKNPLDGTEQKLLTTFSDFFSHLIETLPTVKAATLNLKKLILKWKDKTITENVI